MKFMRVQEKSYYSYNPNIFGSDTMGMSEELYVEVDRSIWSTIKVYFGLEIWQLHVLVLNLLAFANLSWVFVYQNKIKGGVIKKNETT